MLTTPVSGIGAAIAENLAAKGCNLVLNYTSASSTATAQGLADRLRREHGVRALIAQADLGTSDGPERLVELARAGFGDGGFQIDILVNNAGIAINQRIEDVSAADFEQTYRVNVLGPLLLVKAVQPYLPCDRSGRIVNISSVSSDAGFVGQSVYGGSKAALEAMTRTWARELGERCTVNSINPGPVLGPMYAANSDEFKQGIKGWIMHAPLMRARPGVDADDLVADAESSGGRPAYTSEIAGIVGMLCTPDSAWCTGQVVQANGGMMMH